MNRCCGRKRWTTEESDGRDTGVRWGISFISQRLTRQRKNRETSNITERDMPFILKTGCVCVYVDRFHLVYQTLTIPRGNFSQFH